MRIARTLCAASRAAWLTLALPALALAQEVTIHGGLSDRPVAAGGFALEVHDITGSPGAGLRFVPSDADGVKLRAADGCEVNLSDQDGDGRLETRRTRKNGRLTGRCSGAAPQFVRSSLDAGSGHAALEDCRLETRSGGTVVCQPTRFGKAEGEAWILAENVGADSLGWRDGLLILDDSSGTIYRLRDADPDTETRPDLSTLITIQASEPVLPRESRLSKTEEAVSPERQAIIEKQHEAFPRAFKDETDETPQAARAYQGAAARAARRARERSPED